MTAAKVWWPPGGRVQRMVFAWMTLAAAAGLASGAAAEPLRLAVSEGPVSLPIYVAEAERLFEREGVAVQLRDCKSGRDCYRQLASGEASLATAAELVMTLNSASEPEAAIVATISSSVRSIKLVARRDVGIAAPADLRGKRIGTAPGTSAQYFLDSWLVFHEIDPGTVTVVELGPERLVAALDKREVDAVAIWDPVARQALTLLGAGGLVLPDPRIYTQHFSLIATRRSIAEDRPALIRMLRALAQAALFIEANPARAAQILARRLNMPAAPRQALEQVALQPAEHVYRLSLDQSLIGTMEAEARWAVGRGLLPASRRPGNLLPSIEPSLLRTVSPQAVTLVR